MSKLHIRATQRQNVRNESTSQHERTGLDSTTSMKGSRTPNTTDRIQHGSPLFVPGLRKNYISLVEWNIAFFTLNAELLARSQY